VAGAVTSISPRCPDPHMMPGIVRRGVAQAVSPGPRRSCKCYRT
jgi:hypothetical protein